MRDFLLSYDTVTLYPKYSELLSRNDADTTVSFCGHTFNLPVVPANMKDVIDVSQAQFLSENGYFYVYHRFGGEYTTYDFVVNANEFVWKLISISVGVRDEDIKLIELISHKTLRVDFITVDVAHAHHSNVANIFNKIRRLLPSTKIIVGNVATVLAADYLIDLGVDAIKVGIGGGSICTTRYMTGFHIPTLQSVEYVSEIVNESGVNIPIIADGGAKHYGDIAKAIKFGATMVMSGGWFASCIDSPAKIQDGKKLYRGSTSYELKGKKHRVEGRQLELEGGETYKERLIQIKQAIQSSISYAGGTDLSAFKTVEYGRIFPIH